MDDLKRKGEPHDDDVLMQRIEVEFANQLEGHAHLVSGYGSKPMWSQADAVFLGKVPADDAPLKGEPRFDDTVYHVETSCIPRSDK